MHADNGHLTIRDPRWMLGVEECSFQEKVDEIPDYEQFDPFQGLESGFSLSVYGAFVQLKNLDFAMIIRLYMNFFYRSRKCYLNYWRILTTQT